MRNRFLLGAGVALAVALSWADAQAQLLSMPSGPGAWYFGGEGGWTCLDSATGQVGGGKAQGRASATASMSVPAPATNGARCGLKRNSASSRTA